MDVILLNSNYQHVSAIHETIFRAVRTRLQIQVQTQILKAGAAMILAIRRTDMMK